MDPAALSKSPVVYVAAGAILLAIVFLVLWLTARRRYRAGRANRSATDSTVAILELSVAEQGGRLRIIRELHDLTVHQMSTIIAQADGARYAAATDPSAAVRAAEAIAETGRSALADMRRVMTLVRETEAEVAPQPRLKSTRDLFKVMRDAGLRIQFQETGEPYDLNAGAELAVYRILQEALSNCLRYGGDGTEVRVTFTWTPQGLAVRVDDNGFRNLVQRRNLPQAEADAELGYTVEDDLRALTQEITGPGITEMRARTEVFGGILTATEVPGVGFSISATFPAIRYHNGVHGVDLTPHS
jgi:signal transduction histidine kinase